ncbi:MULTISPECIES: EamA family transporter [Acinetobacter]|jgi:inner membrane transporter RhtA|uniref:EamA family transporter n=1 Tax=Acinetobacter radioresistens TaxID=40216 RepID=A0A8H2JYM7_ACIRA|nr:MULTISPECIES: EamA family transporter [Acinetobacter]AWV87453.1 EamA family transporter [Acinetobacter radioresistens]MCK4079314.1 EamA family transporter [Acinetobacter radioresistens]MCK4088519.1 EamA family transporter [Acinetobacter radioresistens]MCK4101767.1 EamA family transporter [Acinetobacter radioresistens]MCK4104012.1 EamA family transporter [Acinetobacter radioresistens]
MSNSSLLAVLFMVLSMISYQISASFAKQLFSVLDPLTVTILRLCFAAVLVTLMFRSWRIISRLPYLRWRDLLCYSASLGLMNILFYLSLDKLPQGIAVGLEFAGPLGLALLSVKYRSDYIWVLLAIIGIVLMVPWGSANAENFSVFGAACALGAGFCWAIYIYFGQKVVQQNIGMHALTIAIIISALALLPIGLYQDAPALVQTQHWGKVLMVALLATAIPYALDLLALKSLSKLSYGTLSSLSPALAALAGMVLLKEQINTWQWVALGCIMLASVGVTVGTSKRSRQPVTDF